ncbi:MAG: ATP12 family protein [Rhizomicrobium sp.]
MTVRTVSRFYKVVAVAEHDGHFVVHLDGKPVKTPHRAILALPNRSLAEAVADEWAAQRDKIDPKTMPLTQLANTAIALLPEHHAKAAERILAYGKADLLCYRAEAPEDLVRRQVARWNPLLDWADATFGARLVVGQGIGFVEQPARALLALEQAVWQRDAFGLVGLHAAATISGSLVLALALAEGRLAAGEALALAQLEERYQAEKWGRDAAAAAREARLETDLEAAERFLRLLAA